MLTAYLFSLVSVIGAALRLVAIPHQRCFPGFAIPGPISSYGSQIQPENGWLPLKQWRKLTEIYLPLLGLAFFRVLRLASSLMVHTVSLSKYLYKIEFVGSWQCWKEPQCLLDPEMCTCILRREPGFEHLLFSLPMICYQNEYCQPLSAHWKLRNVSNPLTLEDDLLYRHVWLAHFLHAFFKTASMNMEWVGSSFLHY